MSLINEALKKAQRLRTADPAGTAAAVPGSGGPVEKRKEPRSAQQLVLMAAGGVALVVLSVVVTFWFVNRPPTSKPIPKPVVVKPADTSAPSPVIVTPAIIPPAVATETPPTKSAPPTVAADPPPAVAAKPAQAPTPAATPPPTAKVIETPAPPAVAPATTPPAQTAAPSAPVPPPLENPPASLPAASAPAPVATTSAPVTTDPRVHAFVDAIKVMGIRSSSGGDSRVLMNDRVFRVNDLVDRNLGVRLTKVEPDMLTFTDANGAIYTKNF